MKAAQRKRDGLDKRGRKRRRDLIVTGKQGLRRRTCSACGHTALVPEACIDSRHRGCPGRWS